jgi:hypothetical protein
MPLVDLLSKFWSYNFDDYSSLANLIEIWQLWWDNSAKGLVTAATYQTYKKDSIVVFLDDVARGNMLDQFLVVNQNNSFWKVLSAARVVCGTNIADVQSIDVQQDHCRLLLSQPLTCNKSYVVIEDVEVTPWVQLYQYDADTLLWLRPLIITTAMARKVVASLFFLPVVEKTEPVTRVNVRQVGFDVFTPTRIYTVPYITRPNVQEGDIVLEGQILSDLVVVDTYNYLNRPDYVLGYPLRVRPAKSPVAILADVIVDSVDVDNRFFIEHPDINDWQFLHGNDEDVYAIGNWILRNLDNRRIVNPKQLFLEKHYGTFLLIKVIHQLIHDKPDTQRVLELFVKQLSYQTHVELIYER